MTPKERNALCCSNGNHWYNHGNFYLFEGEKSKFNRRCTNPVTVRKYLELENGHKNIYLKFFDSSKVDRVIRDEAEARAMTKRLALEEGVFAGMSSGGTVATAVKVKKWNRCYCCCVAMGKCYLCP
jgi:cysteine synthase